MRIVLLCATRRGLQVLRKVRELRPADELVVFSFREEPWEPPFLDDIRDFAVGSGAEFFEARQVGAPRWAEFWRTAALDLMLVVSWRYLIPASVYGAPRLGTFVFHDSLLPAYRGFAPTVWAIVNGDDHTGATLFEIAKEVDAGPIVDQGRVPIGPDDPIAVVLERVTESYLGLLDVNLAGLLAGSVPRRVQNPAAATFCCKRLPEDGEIRWDAPTAVVYNLIRALGTPYPGAFTRLKGRLLRVWAAKRIEDGRRYVGRIPGRIADVRGDEGVVVLTGDGALLVTRVQLEGEPEVPAAHLLDRLTCTLGR